MGMARVLSSFILYFPLFRGGLYGGQLARTSGTHQLAPEVHHVLAAAAEHAPGVGAAQHDGIVLQRDRQRLSFSHVQHAAHLHRNDHSAQIV